MTTIMPKGEKLRNAVKWISAELQDSKDESLYILIEKAALRFNLSPKEEEYLKLFYKQKGEEAIISE